jgi:glycosyltransferase involved in cell wall biosynthesis
VGSALWKRRRDISIVHSFGRLAALLPVLPLTKLPKLQSYHRPGVPWRGVKVASFLSGRSIRFTGCSESVHRARASKGHYGGEWHTIFNPIPLARYAYVSAVAADAPLVYLGKIEREKGVHHAIAIARKARRRLVIAGNRVESGSNAGYFEREIEPQLAPGEVDYVGEADDVQKNKLLGQAAALLFPTSYEETFGLVLAEAMACGTPAIGFARGAVPEVIRDGVNGFLCNNVDDAAAAVARIASLDRAEVRRDCEARFSDTAFIDTHERLYAQMVAVCGRRPA